MRGQNDVYPATAAKIHYRFTELKVGETGRIATTPGEVAGNCRQQSKLRIAIEPLIHGVARTGLRLAGSAGFLLGRTGLGKFTVSTFNHLLNFFHLHNFLLSFQYWPRLYGSLGHRDQKWLRGSLYLGKIPEPFRFGSRILLSNTWQYNFP